MGLFSFVKDAGEKLFGSDELNEGEIRNHILAQGLALNPLTVVADNEASKVTLIGFAKTVDDKEKAILTAGNVDGVESVEDRLKIGVPEWVAEAAAAEAAEAPDDMPALSDEDAATAQFYTVKSGDTLGKIAQETLGSASKYPEIFEANRPMLSDPDKIYPGQVLRIPA